MVVSFSTDGAQIAYHPSQTTGLFHKKQEARSLSLLDHPGVCNYQLSIHFSQHQIRAAVTQGQANERFLVTEAGLTDDRKAGGGVSWQGLLERGRVACWEAEPSWGSGCCCMPGCLGGKASNPLLTALLSNPSFPTLPPEEWLGLRPIRQDRTLMHDV